MIPVGMRHHLAVVELDIVVLLAVCCFEELLDLVSFPLVVVQSQGNEVETHDEHTDEPSEVTQQERPGHHSHPAIDLVGGHKVERAVDKIILLLDNDVVCQENFLGVLSSFVCVVLLPRPSLEPLEDLGFLQEKKTVVSHLNRLFLHKVVVIDVL